MSATMSGISDVKETVKVAKNEKKLTNRQTVLFMDEVHRFNKMQQVRLNLNSMVTWSSDPSLSIKHPGFLLV